MPYGTAEEVHRELQGQVWETIADSRLDSPEMRAISHLSTLVVKTVTDCNLRCTYGPSGCYEYVDKSWQLLPPTMKPEIIEQVGGRIREYADLRELKAMRVVLHGGEPLYMHKPEVYYGKILPLLRKAAGIPVAISMQTNGSLLRPPILDVLQEQGVRIGVSVDGGEAAHNLHRRTKEKDLGTFAMAQHGVDLLRTEEYRKSYVGLLAVVSLQNDPIQVYEDLLQLTPPKIDFLLPHANWDSPPFVPEGNHSRTPHADWLLQVFHRWMDDWKQGLRPPNIRTFSSIIQMRYNGQSQTELIGPYAGNEITVRTNGDLELLDSVKTAFEGAAATNMNISTYSLEDVAVYMRKRGLLGLKNLAAECRACPLHNQCGGGGIAHRYGAGSFDHPSVYSADLKKLITEIGNAADERVCQDLVVRQAIPSNTD